MRVLLLVSLLVTLSACGGGSPFGVETRTPAPAGELTLEQQIQLKRQQERYGRI